MELNASVSSSTKSISLFWINIPFSPIFEKYSHLSSQPLLWADKFETITANEAPRAPQYAEIDPPPGAGDSLEVILAKSTNDLFDKFLFFSSIIYSIILVFGSKFPNSSNPRDFTAIWIISLSGIAFDLFCLVK